MMLVPYVVRKNEWLGLIARMHHVSLRELLRYNPQIRNPDHLWEGMTIKVPLDNAIRPGDVSAGRDANVPILGPYATAPDGTIIRLPSSVSLPYYGIARITSAMARGADVTGMRGVGYALTLVVGDGSGHAGAEFAKDVGEHGAVEGGIHGGVLPRTAGPLAILLSLLNPKTAGGEYMFTVMADNGTRTKVTVQYPAD